MYKCIDNTLVLGRRKNCFRERGESIDRSIEVIDDRMRDRTNEFRTRERERGRDVCYSRCTRKVHDRCLRGSIRGWCTRMACNYRSLHVLVIASGLSGRRFSSLRKRKEEEEDGIINGESLVIIKYLREGILFQRR